MSILKKGAIGAEVIALQRALISHGYQVELDGEFGSETELAVKAFQSLKGLAIDGVVGPLTLKALGSVGTEDPKPPVDTSGPMPWFDWVKARLGWTEFDHDKELSKYWPLSGLDYKTVIGSEHAWCLLTVNAALHETGYKGNGRADAVSARHIGNACELRPGCIVVFQWDSGEHHVTFCDHIVDGKTVACLGGNQSNSIRVSNFPRRNIIATRWPVK